LNRVLSFLALAAACAASAGAQSADSIIKDHIKAAGGEKALKAITSVRYAGTATAADGQVRPFLWFARKPDRLYIELHAAAGPVIDASNGRSAWREDAGGLRTVTGNEQTRARATALFRNDRLLNWKKDKVRAGFAGTETIHGRRANVVEMTSHTGVQRKLCFDAETRLLVKEQQPYEDGLEEILYADYRAVGRVQEPHRLTIRRGDASWDVTLTDVAHNPVLADEVFDFPKRAAVPLPDVPALLKEVEKNQETIEKIRENYTYTLEETNLEVDGKGRLKEKSEKTYEVFHLGPGWTVRKLIGKDGRKLTPSEERKEQKEVLEIIEKYEKWKKDEPKRMAEAEKKSAKRAAQGKDQGQNSDEDDGRLTLADFMRLSLLTNPRRERFRGEEVLVFEFSPRPGLKPKNRSESLVQKLGGIVWIDEKARQVARLEARMLDNFRLAGGLLASLHRGSAVVFEQEMVRGELWLPRYAEINFSARFLLLAGFKINQVQRFSDYKRFNVESISEIKAPAQPPL